MFHIFNGDAYASDEEAMNRPTEGVKILSPDEMKELEGVLDGAGHELFTDPALGGGQLFMLIGPSGAARKALSAGEGQFCHVRSIGAPEPQPAKPEDLEGDPVEHDPNEGKGDETPEPQDPDRGPPREREGA